MHLSDGNSASSDKDVSPNSSFDDQLLSGLSDIPLSDEENIQEIGQEESSSPVFDSCPLSCKVSALLTMALISRHKLTTRAANDIIALLVAHWPDHHRGFTSLYTLKSRFAEMVGKQPEMQTVNYCKQCHSILNESLSCQECDQAATVGEYLQVNLEKQIQQLFQGMIVSEL